MWKGGCGWGKCRGTVPLYLQSPQTPSPPQALTVDVHTCVCVYLSVHMCTHTHIIMTFGLTALLYLNATKSASFNTLFY